MKAFLAMVLTLGLFGLAGASDDKPVSVETWKCEYADGRICILQLKKDGDKLSGEMSWPDQKETDAQKPTSVKNLKLKDGNLTFSVIRKFKEDKFTFDFDLKIDGDKLKGKGETRIMGQTQEFDITGKREKKDK